MPPPPGMFSKAFAFSNAGHFALSGPENARAFEEFGTNAWHLRHLSSSNARAFEAF